MRKKIHGFVRRLIAAIVCLNLSLSIVGGMGFPAFAASSGRSSAAVNHAQPTEHILEFSRVADPDTMDSYTNILLNKSTGSRYAGRVWTDKSVFAYKDGNSYTSTHFKDGNNTLTLDMTTDGYNGDVSFNADFLHVFSALASSQIVNEYPPQPLDVMFVLDVSGSMGQIMEDGKSKVVEQSNFNSSPIYQTVEALNKAIKTLLSENPNSRFGIVIYGSTAAVLVPLGHYTEGSLKTTYKEAYGTDQGLHFNIEATVKPEGKNGEDEVSKTYYADNAGESNNTAHNDNSSSDGNRKFDGTGGHTTGNGEKDTPYHVGHITNPQAGLAAAMDQFITNNKELTWTTLIDGEEYLRLPALIHLTDGQASDLAWIQPDGDESSQDAWKKETSTWNDVNWEYDLAYNSPLNSKKDGEKNYYNASQLTGYGDAAPVIFQTLMTASYYKSAVEAYYNSAGKTVKNGTTASLMCYSVYASDSKKYGEIDDNQVTATIDAILNPEEKFVDSEGSSTDSKDLKGAEKKDKDGNYTVKSEDVSNPEAFIDTAYELFKKWKENNCELNDCNTFTTNTTSANSLANDITIKLDFTSDQMNGSCGAYCSKEWNKQITKKTIEDNINYVPKGNFFHTGFNELNDVFDQIIELLLGKVFVPVSGNNDAGVGDSITYQDPIGDYMEIKNGAVTYRNSKEPEGAATTDYDMSMLLFGEMYGLVRTGIYDYKWNDEWMKAHDTAHQGQLAFTQGWYKGEAASAESGGSGELPTGYSNAAKAWADGWVYRINYKTLIQYVPIVNATESDTPESMPPQVQNTVYTIYRFSCSKAERNALRRNPVYGEVPDDLENTWNSATAGGQYPNNDSLYEDYPGVYRLSDIRVWVEYYGDFVDQDGAITTDRGYDSSLYLNIPAAAIPTELATITLGRNGVLSYKTNLGSDHPVGSYDTVVTKDASGNEVEQKIQVDEAMYNSYCYQSTPLRLFYTVGLEEDLIIRDASGKQTGVNVAALPEEYVSTHTIAERSTIYFVSNYFSATKYNDYVTGESTRGDPAVTFSPSSDNRYYVFQKPLPLYAHAYRVQANGSLLPVDRNDGQTWGKNLGGNGDTVWEDTADGKTGGSSWLGGVYMGVYESEDAFKNAATETSASLSPSGVGMPKTDKLIKDSQGIWYPYVENGIVFLTSDLLDNVDENSGKSFESDDYFFLLLEYYTPGDEVGVNNSGEPLYGTNSGSTIQYAVARKGSDFGSGFASTEINNGDMLCWAETQGKLNLSNNVGFKYLSFTETGDKTRGRPTFEKLTLDESALKTYLKDNCGIQNEAVLSEQAEYWQTMQNDPQVQAALEAAKAAQTGNKDKLTEEGFNAYFKFAVSARPGGIRTGNMANERQRKTPNPTETSETYYVPTVSNSSSIQNIVLNSYLGNNGRLEVGNSQLLVTKTLHIPEDYTYGSELNKDETFNYQIYIAGAGGSMDATMVNYNPISKLWQCRIGYIDVLVDTKGMLLTSDNEPALFVYEAGTAKQVKAVTDDNGNTSYYYVNDEGGPNGNPTLYYLYLSKDPGSSDDSDKLTRRIYQDSDYNDESDKIAGFENSAVMYYGEDQTKPADSANDGIRYAPLTSSEITEGSEITAGTVVYEVKEAELVPKSEVDGNEEWSHAGSYQEIKEYPIATVKPNAHDSTQEIISPFGTKTMYMKKTLEFGKNANSDGSSSGELTASDLYDQFNPSYDRSDLFGASDNATIASSTAEFALKQGEGLLLTGLGNRVAYRFTEKLTDDQIAKGYVLEQINHIQQIGSESIYKLGLQEIPTYGDTEGSPTTEPFHHTNATMWEYYATFGPNEYSSHHCPAAYGGISKNPNCEKCDEDVGDGNIRHYMYREGELIDSHYEGEPSSFSNRISRYLVSPTVHFGIEGDSEYSQYSAANIEKYECSEKYNGVYSVFGNTGYFEEQANFTNTVKKGSLTVEKKISLEEKDSLKVKTEITDDEKEFEFKFEVELSGKNIDGEYKAQKMTRKVQETGGVYGPTFESVSPEYITIKFDESGKSEEFTLKGGESLTIYGIPIGTTYTVTEKAEGRGYWKPTVSGDDSDNSDGAVATGTITEKGGKAECTVTFDNKKPNPEPVYVSIGLTKKVTIIGEDSHFEEYPEISAEDFTFEVTPDSGNGEYDPFKAELTDGMKIVNIGAGSNYTASANIFENLKYEKKGTYKYYVKEIVPELEKRIDGMTYSYVRYTIEVVVTEDTVTEGGSDETRLALKADVYVYTDDSNKGKPVASSTGKVDAGNEKIAFENIIGGELIITKEVENAPENDNTEFNFTLELTQNNKPVDGPFPYVITKDGKEVKSGHLISSGSGERDDIVADGNVWTLALKNGESITIKELPTGAAYTISEADSENSHYLFKSVSVEGGTPSEDKTVKGVIGASGVGDIVTVSYKNEYIVGSMTISKALAGGSNPDTDTEFEFKLTLTPPNGKRVEDLEGVNITPSAEKEKGDGTVTYTFNLKADGSSVTLTDIPIGTSYTLTETPNAKDNYVFESAKVTVGGIDEEEIADGIKGTISKESSNIDIVVTNKPCTPTTVNLEGTKKVIGADFKLGDKFKFKITRTSASGTDPKPDVVSESPDGTIRFFDNLEFTEPGTYTYTIKEVKSPSIEGIEYDDTVYTVTVEVSETDDGELRAAVSYPNLKDGEDSIIFENSHKLGSLKVRKIIDDSANQLSEDYKKDLIFNFKLTLKNDNIKSFEPLLDNQPLKKAEDGDYWTFTLTDNETIEITNLPVGTECSVEETNPLGFTPKYDPEDHEDVIRESAEAVTITVTNKNPDSTELTLTGKKTFKYDDEAGIDLKGGEFEFILSAEDDKTPMPNGQFGGSVTISNDSDGSFNFGKITYKEVGTYNYTVSEVRGSESNYTYDTSVYNVTVTVSKDGDALKTDVKVEKDGQPVDLTSEGAVFEFTNTKKRTPTELTIEGLKNLDGNPSGVEFSFGIRPAPESPADIPMPENTTVSNNGEGKFFFGPIKYTAAGEYVYEIYEIPNPDEDKYVYDTTVYRITVRVTEEGGGLTAEYGASEEVTTTARIVYYATVINGMAVPAATPNMGGGIIFNNTTVTPIGNLTISKIVKNEDDSIVNDGSDTTLFDFTVKLVAPEGTSLPSTYVPDEGKDYMSFHLTAGQSMSFSNLPVGTEYYISEVNQQGYTCENPEVNGVITENGETVAVDIVNIKPAPKQKTGNLEVVKHVIGDGDKLKEWHIKVTLGEALTGQYGDMYFENGVAKLTVTDGVTVTAVGLPVGITYTVAELEENTGGYVTTYVGKTGEIPADGTAHAEVVNDLPATPPPSESDTGSLTVAKTVQSPNPNDYMRPFGFMVQLSDPTINGCYGDMVFSDGVAYITLTSGQSLTAVGLPVGISYSIYETDAYGFTVLVNGMPSSGVASGTILSDSVSFEAFTNISNIPEPEYGGLTVTKTVEGSGADYEKYFTFTVTLSEPLTGQYGQMFFNNGVAVFTLKHGESCTAFGIPAGTYYTVTEYDNEGYEVTSVGEVGTVIANTVVSADFVNTREEPEDEPEEDKGGLTVKKTVTGSDGDRFKEFTFTVTLSDTSINGAYGDMIFVDGVAAFTLRHGESITASGLPAGISYTVTETDNEGYTVVSFGETGTIPANGEATAEFVNSRGDSDEFGNLTVEKFVTGFGIDYQDFTFTVTLSAPITGQYGQMFFNDGVAVFTLKHGETATAVGLPAGVSYTVIESNNDYYIVSSSGDAGIIVNNGSAYCEYINYLTEEDYPKVIELLEQPAATVDTNPPTGIDYIDYMGTAKILLVIVALGVVVKRIKER